MANQRLIFGSAPDLQHTAIRHLVFGDLTRALSLGFKDFVAMPSATLFVALIYPVIGLLLGKIAFGQNMIPLLFPLVAGFALIGPVAAIGLYEMSRQREKGGEVSWRSAFGVLNSGHLGSILAMGALLAVLFFFWIVLAEGVYNWAFGYVPAPPIADFLTQVTSTGAGWKMMLAGNALGFVLAALALTISVVSFPMILDRGVTAPTAIETSVRVTLENPVIVAVWGLIIAAALIIGAIPALIGLIVVMPVLGHATWHLYRRAVV